VVLALDSILIVALYVITFLTLFALRRREPDTPRPYRARGYPVIPALTLLIAVALLAALSIGDPRSAMVVLAILLASWVASGVVRRMMRRS
jgi:amino acid transporter